MCGRYVLAPVEQLAERFDIQQEPLEFQPRYNVTPSQIMPVVVRNSPNRLVAMQWGLIPAWSKAPRMQFSTINARAETLAKSPVFRGPFKSRRCLVPASGFYEWQAQAQGKQPFCIRLSGGELFAFAGLYDIWRDDDGNELHSYTIVTTAPNELVAPIHNRMPVILRREDENAWLDPDSDLAHLLGLLRAYPASAMEAYPVSRGVNSPSNDSAELIQAV